MRSHWVRGSPAPPAPLPRCGPCGSLHVCLRNTLGGTGLKPVPTNAVKDRAAGRPHPSPTPALRALRWPPRLSQKYARRDGVETDVCQQFVNRCHGSLSQKYTRRDGVETRPYQCDERQPSPASAVVNPTSRFETRPYQRDERQSCGLPAPPAPLPCCGRGGIVNVVSLKDVGAGSPLLSTRSKSRVSDHSLTYLLLTVALPELG